MSGNQHDLAREAVALVTGHAEANEYAKAREMREAEGVAKHGIEGWRLLTANWETTVDVLRRQLEWQRIELGEQRDRLAVAKAKLRHANRHMRKLNERLLVQQRALRARRWKTSKPLTRKKLSSASRRAKPRRSAATGRKR